MNIKKFIVKNNLLYPTIDDDSNAKITAIFNSRISYRYSSLESFSINYKNGFIDISTISRNDRNQLGEIKSVVNSNQKMIISSPFEELDSIGNEIAIYQLIHCSTMTFHAAASLLGSHLFLFIGKSNSGKSTVNYFFKHFEPYTKIISDDFVLLALIDGGVYVSTPVYEILNNYDSSNRWYEIDEITVVNLSCSLKISNIFDLISVGIASSFLGAFSFEFYRLLGEINKNISCTFINRDNRDSYTVAYDLYRLKK